MPVVAKRHKELYDKNNFKSNNFLREMSYNNNIRVCVTSIQYDHYIRYRNVRRNVILYGFLSIQSPFTIMEVYRS